MPAILAAPTTLVTELLEDPTLSHDFSKFSAYVDNLGVLYLNGRGKQSSTLAVEPPRADTGQSEFETRPDFGNHFGQGDFSGGALQRFFHRPTADKTQFRSSEGFDVSEPGVMRHLNSVSSALPSTFTGPTILEEADDVPFVAQGADVYQGNGAFPGSWINEDPHDSEGDTTVLDLASRGDELFAALGTNGVHIRSSAGAWTHFQPDSSTDLDVGTATRVAFLKDRLFVVGAAGRSIYEVVADSTPTAMETLPEGWTFESMCESGPYVYATAVCPTAGLSRVHAFGLNDDGSAIEKKSSTSLPKGEMAYTCLGYLGRMFVAGGRQTSSAGMDALLYEGIPGEDGSLQLLLIAAEDDDAADDFAVRTMTALRDAIVLGWSRENGRTGLATYNLARNAFTYHLKDNSAVTPSRVHSAMRFRGRVVFTTDDGLFYEVLNSPVPTATLVSSTADWNNVGLKDWSLFQVRHEPLVINTSVSLDFTRRDPVLEEWEPVLTSELPGAGSVEEFVSDLRTRALAVRLTSTASGSDAPEINSFSVRSTPAPEEPEWTLVRTIRLVDRDRKDRRAEAFSMNPASVRRDLHDMAYTWVTLYEPGITWIGYVQNISEVDPAEVPASETAGPREGESFYVEMRLVARRA